MAAGSVSPFEVGSYFIQQYYRVLQESPDYSHRFYTHASKVTRIDGDATDNTSNIGEIHELLTSLHIKDLEVTKLTAQDSWDGGILVIVSGYIRSENFNGRRKFTQTFFLAPQEKGYFVLNDIFQFDDEGLVNQHPMLEISDIKVDSEVHVPSPHLEQPVSDYDVEEESRDYVNPSHIEDDNPVDKYSLPDEHQPQELETEFVVHEAPVQESLPSESAVEDVNHVHESAPVPTTEPAGDPPKLTYASILRTARSQAASSVATQPTVRQTVPSPPEQNEWVQATATQSDAYASAFVPETTGVGTDEGFTQDGELTSIYVRNLPSNVTAADLEKEFKNFGRIKPDGIFIKNRKDIGVCFAFVEYEDMSGVHNAIKASPIQLLGRQVIVEERRASSNSAARGGGSGRGRGRGRGSYQNEPSRGRIGTRNPGRGGAFDGNDYNRSRGNGILQRGP